MKKTAFIFAKSEDQFYQQVLAHLKARGVTVADPQGKGRHNVTIVLGGDGTVLAAARKGVQNPILVINTGHLGFLTSSSQENFKTTIDNFLEGRYSTTVRRLLDVSLGKKKLHTALNDVVITKDGLSKLAAMSLYVVDEGKEQFVSEYRADGLIISTPTGSTAYNLSASGPIVHPQCNVFVVTPICPQGLTQRPLVLPSNVRVRVKPIDSDLYLSIDGQIGQPLNSNAVTVKFNSHTIELINPEASYFEILRHKLGWGISIIEAKS